MKMTTTTFRSVLARTVAVARPRRLAMSAAFIVLAMSTLATPLRAQLATTGILLGDFNGDGIQDVLVAPTSSNPSSFTVSFGSVPFGSFSATAKSVPLPSGCAATTAGATVIGDFNGDGFTDIATSCLSTQDQTNPYSLFVLLGNGDGTFKSSGALTGLSLLVAGDFDHDGILDLISLGSDGSGNEFLIFMKGIGDGTFQSGAQRQLSNNSYQYAAAVDLNGDGYPDLAMGNFNGSTDSVDIFANNKDGTFGSTDDTTAPTTSIALSNYTGSSEKSVLVGNFYGSGLPDLAVIDGGTAPGISVIKNNSTDGFSFGEANKFSVPGLITATAASFTSNFTDFLVANGSTLSVLANDGTGTFASSYTALSINNTLNNFVAADANFDGHADIYTATLTSTGVSLTVNLVSGTASASSTPFSLPLGSSAVSAVWPGNVNFIGSNLTGTQIVGGITPVITWPTPAPIAYGTALSATQLDATAATAGGVTVPGTFVYTPAAGSVPGVGTQTLNVVFTPTDLVTYTVANGTTSLVVNKATPALTWTPSVASIVYGTALGASQLDAVATGVGGNALAGTLVYTPASGTVLAAGAQTLSVVFTPTDAADYVVARLTTQIAVTKATPGIAWTPPAPIAYGVPLSATQLDATATGIAGVTLPGSFVYTPAAGSTPKPGVDTLSVAFTPTDAANYAATTGTVNITITDVTLNALTPNTAALGSPATTITITGSGIVSTTVVQVNGTAVATTTVNPTTLTAVIPASDFLVPGSLQITLMNPATGSVSGVVSFTVTAPALSGTLTGPSTTSPGTQPNLTFNIEPYPVDVTATLTVSLKSSIASGVTDTKNVVFSNGSNVFTFTVKAGSTSIPSIPLAAGTVAETITVTPNLFIGTVDVTPEGLAPVTIDVPAEVPQAMSTTLTRSGDQLTVTIIGFSNTREVTSAAFHFVAAPGSTLTQTDLKPTVDDLFTTWYDGTSSPDFGSSFTYAQVFNVSDTSANIGSVQVTLTNSVGTSIVETAK